MDTPVNDHDICSTHDALEGKDLIERTPTGYAFLDPGFELWFKWEILEKKVRAVES
jgi:hypothetical protein